MSGRSLPPPEDGALREDEAVVVFGREDVALLTAAEAAAIDREARESGGIPERVLMENAGRAAALIIHRLFPTGRIVAAVGSGHNGGDALVALRSLQAWGREVAYLPVGSRPPPAGLEHGHTVPRLDEAEAAEAFAGASVLVDGILGTGAEGAPRGGAARAVEMMDASGRPIVALDLPSGVDPTTAEVPGPAIQAAVTVTFGWPKLGLLFQPARARCGRLVAVEIGFPPLAPDHPPSGALITPAWAAAHLPSRPALAHKGTFGRLLVLAGSAGMAGAAALCARGAGRAGAGLVRVASDAGNREILQALVPEAIFVDRGEAAMAAAAGDAAALLAGPGLGLDAAAETALRRALDGSEGRATLLDADALTLLGRDGDALQRVAGERRLVVTPHAGELSRLTGRVVSEIVAGPVGAARRFAEELGCVVLLKGLPSVVATPGEPVLVNTVGSSDLATAGSGDTLAGVVAAFLAAGAPPRDAAALGLFFASRAADLAGYGRALTASDIADRLPEAFRSPGLPASSLGLPFVTFDQPPRW